MEDTQAADAQVTDDILGGTTPAGEETVPATEDTSSTDSDEAASESEDAQAAAESEEPAEGQEAGEGTSTDPFKELIDKKYGGDKNKMYEGWVHLMNAGANQHKKIESLEGKISELLEQLSANSPQRQAIVDDSPEVQGLTQQLTGIDSEAQYAQQQQNSVLDQIARAERDVARLEGKLEKADDFDKGMLRQELLSKSQELRGLTQEFRNLERERRNVLAQKQTIQRQLDQTIKGLQDQMSQQRQQELDNTVYRKQFLTVFGQAVDDVASKVGFAVDSEERQWLYKLVKTDAKEFLAANPEASIDPKTFVPQRAQYHLRISGLAKRAAFTKTSQTKAAAAAATVPARPSNGNGTPPARPPVQPLNKLPNRKLTPDEARAWTARILG